MGWKIEIKSEEHSKEIQEIMLKNNYKWSNIPYHKVKNTTYKYLYFNIKKFDITFGKDPENFKDKPFTEIFTLNPKQVEWLKKIEHDGKSEDIYNDIFFILQKGYYTKQQQEGLNKLRKNESL